MSEKSCLSSKHIWHLTPPSLCLCRTCYPWLEIPPRELPTTTLRTSLILACSPPSLSNTPPSLSTSLPVRTGLAFISHVVSHFSMLLVHNTPLMCSTVNVCSCHSHTVKHSLLRCGHKGFYPVFLWTYTYLIAAKRNLTVRMKEWKINQLCELFVLPPWWTLSQALWLSAVSSRSRAGFLFNIWENTSAFSHSALKYSYSLFLTTENTGIWPKYLQEIYSDADIEFCCALSTHFIVERKKQHDNESLLISLGI